MARSVTAGTAFVMLGVLILFATGAMARGNDFTASAAVMVADLPSVSGFSASSGASGPVVDLLDATAIFPGGEDFGQSTTTPTEPLAGDEPLPSPVTTEATTARPAAIVAEETRAPTTAPQPVVTPAPQPVRTAAPTAAPIAVQAEPLRTTCPATWFCYPRLGIAGPIVPYTDCSGSTDIGTAIRSYSCLSDNYLMGHAYTQFGQVRQWAAGDVVFAWGKRYTVSGASTQQSCSAPVFPLAPLSMQTSLTSSACGAVLVVQAY